MVQPQKIEQLSKLKDDFANTRLAVIADYRGLDVERLTSLRCKLRAESTKLKVIKNTFLKRIAEEKGWEGLEPMLEGPTAIAYADTEAIPAVKVLSDFAKANKELIIKGGLLEGKVMSESDVAKLASLPTREQLLSQLLSVMQGPMRNLVSVLAAPMRDLVCTLQAVADEKSN